MAPHVPWTKLKPTCPQCPCSYLTSSATACPYIESCEERKTYHLMLKETLKETSLHQRAISYEVKNMFISVSKASTKWCHDKTFKLWRPCLLMANSQSSFLWNYTKVSFARLAYTVTASMEFMEFTKLPFTGRFLGYRSHWSQLLSVAATGKLPSSPNNSQVLARSWQAKAFSALDS